ncbi:non-ribosomal peptide synthetase [Fischerella thermalis CCMEE 5282]|nr:non-ribosomal peptide synthetase [Fischerella thermalis CCMEE 5282]
MQLPQSLEECNMGMKNIADFYPLSPMQQGILFHCLADPKSGVYFDQFSCIIEGNLNIAAFHRAWQQVVNRHSILRTCFLWEGLKEPVQVVHRQVTLPFVHQDWRHLSSVAQQEQIEAFLSSDRCQGFNLTVAPLMRLVLIQLTDYSYHFIWSSHHLLLDGWSVPLIFQEVLAFYKTFAQGQTLFLPSPHPYRDYIVWLQQQNLSEAETFWRQTLKGFTAPTKIGENQNNQQTSTDNYKEQQLRLQASTTAALQSLAQKHQLTLNTLVQGAWALLLNRYSGEADVLFGVTVSGRPAALPKAESMVGLFINTLPFRVKVDPEAFLLPWLKQVQVQQVETRQYEYSPLVEIQGWSEVNRGLPLFESILVFENYPVDISLSEPGLDLAIKNFRSIEQTNYPLTLSVIPGKELLLTIAYNEGERFAAATIDRMLGHLATLLNTMVANPQQRLKELSLLTAAEKQQLLVEWNSTKSHYPQDLCIHQLFEAQVERTPDAVAVVFADQQLTYRELNCRANQLAHELQKLGVGPEVLVGVCVERSLETVIAILAILKAGGAYIPLDPSYPPQRLALMLEDAKPLVLLTQAGLVAELPPHTAKVVLIDNNNFSNIPVTLHNPISGTKPENLAYVIYTSGSTGRAKGVTIQHSSLVNAYFAWEETYHLHTDVTCHLQMASFSFDVFSGDLVRAVCSGGKLVLCPRDLLLSPQDLYNLMVKEKVDCAEFVPAVLRNLMQYLEESQQQLDFMRLLICGSDVWYTKEYQKFRNFCGSHTRLINSFGLTEATIDSSWFETTTQELVNDQLVPIGRPFANTELYIFDSNLQPVPIGVPGELYIGGYSLARGYLHRPDLTCEKFIPHPYSNEPGVRLYKTGDLARYLPSGDIEYIGRIDHQVKLRGFRIELGEIEAVISQHPAISASVVIVREDDTANKTLVAYITLHPDQTLTIPELRRFLEAKLPNYMLPTAFVILEALPLTPNGKIDRRSLPAPDPTQLISESNLVAPSTPVEEMLAGIWTEVLSIQKVGIHDNFFELGGHSLLATRVISQLRQVFKVELPLRCLFNQPTVAGLAKEIEKATKADLGLEIPPIQRISRTADLPLSFAQQRLWFLAQLEPDSPFYNIIDTVHLQGQLNLAALEQSFNEILRRHEALRTNFKTVEGQPVAFISSVTSQLLTVIDLAELPAAQRETKVKELALAEAQQPFNLETDTLLRVKLLSLSEQEYVILLTMHHIVSDGWSTSVLVHELATLYQAFCHGQPSPLPELPIQYIDFAAWQKQWLTGEVLESQLAYWRQQLHGAPAVLELPTDHPRPAVQSFRGATHSFRLSPEQTLALKTLSQQEGSTLFMTLLAAFKTLLYRYTGNNDIVIGSPIANRNHREIEGLIGFFVNTLVLRTDLSGNPSFRELLRRVREVALGAYAHQDVPFEKLVEKLQPQRNLSHTPLFQVMFVLQNAHSLEIELPSLTLSTLESDSGTAKFDLTLYMAETASGMIGSVEYNTDLFEPQTIQRLAEHFQRLLSGIVANPEQRLEELPLLSEAEQQQLLVEWNDTETEYPNQCIHQLFAAQVERTPDAVAVVFQDEQLTYTQLNQRANQLAHYLQKLGVKPEVLVGICLPRSIEMLVGLLAILKAGGAYVPIDPAYPQQRLALMLEDAQVSVLLTQQHLLEKLPAHQARVVCLDSDRSSIAQESQDNPINSSTANCLAYVIYTSGSTGKPKGVLGLHQGAVNRFAWMWQNYPFKQGEVCCQKTSLNFVDSVWEIFGPLLQGVRIVIIPDSVVKAPQQFIEILASNKITRLVVVPSLLRVLLDTYTHLQQRLPQLQLWVTSGEALSHSLLQKFRQTLPESTLLNLYGSSEVSADVTCYSLSPQDAVPARVVIGRPIANTQVYVLDRNLKPVPIGVPGEVYIGGVGLARGYFNRPEMTVERFIPNIFSALHKIGMENKPPRHQEHQEFSLGFPEVGTRLYKTGDFARYLVDGNLEFLGRIDNQVKIRGSRIELGEIEAALVQYSGVEDAVVVAREDRPNHKQLVAYVVAQKEQVITVSELHRFLKEKLPDYMLPSAFVILEAIPLLPNGKVDRHSLPAPDQTRPELAATYQPPQTEVEKIIAQIWQEVLHVNEVGIHDNFFELGGHSLLLLQIHNQLQKRFQQSLSILELFRYPTISSLAKYLSQEQNKQVSFSETGDRSEQLEKGKARIKQFLTISKRNQ